ncbi:MAG: hypothetical protein WCC60_21700 [Ilumatobacteraceae bacterium]
MSAPTTDQARPSRRTLLRLAGATAAGAAAGLAATSHAAADNGVSLLATANATGELTRVNYIGTTPGAAFLFQAGTNGAGATSHYPAALAGWTTTPQSPSGVHGETNRPNGFGVVAANTDLSGVGEALRAISSSGVGARFYGVAGLHSFGELGIFTEGSDVGLYVVGGKQTAISSLAADGTPTDPSARPVVSDVGAQAAVTKTAIFAEGEYAGIFAVATNFGVVATGDRAAVLLQPGENPAAPTARADEHSEGELLRDGSGALWYCVTAGKPGTWRRLAAASTAGALHAITPTRVYDSRQALPTPGPLSNGQNRTISVKDGRSISGGAVTVANAVPPGATAVAANITITGTTGTGFLAVNPGGNTTVTASAINWFGADQTIANGLLLTLNASRELTIICDGGGSTHVIVDITGYYL